LLPEVEELRLLYIIIYVMFLSEILFTDLMQTT